MARLVDATGTVVEVPRSLRRVVSLVPSTTETVFALGCGERLVGVTRYCVRPELARHQAAVVGGTKSPRIDFIRRLQPDLILANQEENREEDVRKLRELAAVYVAFPRDVPGALAEIVKLGVLLDREVEASRLATELKDSLEHLREEARSRPSFLYFYLIWRRPYLAAGPGTFIASLLGEAGGRNALGAEAARYPEVTVSEIERARPEVVLFSSEPFPFRARHVEEFLSACRDRPVIEGRALLVDGQLLSWHGARMREGLPYLAALARQIVALRRAGD